MSPSLVARLVILTAHAESVALPRQTTCWTTRQTPRCPGRMFALLQVADNVEIQFLQYHLRGNWKAWLAAPCCINERHRLCAPFVHHVLRLRPAAHHCPPHTSLHSLFGLSLSLPLASSAINPEFRVFVRCIQSQAGHQPCCAAVELAAARCHDSPHSPSSSSHTPKHHTTASVAPHPWFTSCICPAQ